MLEGRHTLLNEAPIPTPFARGNMVTKVCSSAIVLGRPTRTLSEHSKKPGKHFSNVVEQRS
jgi:hypothetical protein